MEWNLAYGGKNASFFENLGPDHKVNASRPDLLEENEFIFRVWSELSPSRPVYFGGLGAIPLVEIEAYCRMAGIEGDSSYWLSRHVRQIDMMYIETVEARKKRENPDASS